MPGQGKPFHELLQHHLEQGTRAGQRADDPSRRKWKHADFANQAGVGPRTLTNWKNGSRTPERRQIDKIAALLFGDIPQHAAAKAEFLAAWTAADGRQGRTGTAPPETLIPPRQAGPYVGIGPDMRIRQEPPPELDAAGNNLRRIGELLPLVREAIEDLAARIGPNPNAFPELARILTRYRSALASGEQAISWGLVWGLGVRLEETAAAAERQIDRLAPALEDAAHAALQAWRTLHAPLILATAEGRELQEQADQLRMTRAEQSALREDAMAVAEALRRADNVIEPETAEGVTQAAEAIGQGRHSERGTVFGIATIKNTTIVLVGAAVVAMPTVLVGGVAGVGVTMAAWETAKHTPFYTAALKALGADMHRLIERGGPEAERLIRRLAPFRAFVRANEEPLRRIAGSTQQLRWMSAYVDFIVRTDTEPSVGREASIPHTRHPTKSVLEKPDWASGVGCDQYGTYAYIDFHAGGGAVVTQRLRWIAPGRCMMGSPKREPGRYDDEGPRHTVTIGQGFWLFDTQCTQALWQAVMGGNPSRFKSPTRPVENGSFADIQGFLDRLNERVPGLNLVLPSEAQWEYACRAGTREATYAGPMEILGESNAPVLDAIAWYRGNSGVDFELKDGTDSSGWPDKQYPHERAGTHPVAAKAPNPWGLYDMLGNVWEWCADHWHGSYDGAPDNGSAWLDAGADVGAAFRVIRGGSWLAVARNVRAAYRLHSDPALRFDYLGFRCARVQD